jgi:hypothetical protein
MNLTCSPRARDVVRIGTVSPNRVFGQKALLLFGAVAPDSAIRFCQPRSIVDPGQNGNVLGQGRFGSYQRRARFLGAASGSSLRSASASAA